MMIVVLWVELRPSEKYLEALTPIPVNVTLFGNGILADAFKM